MSHRISPHSPFSLLGLVFLVLALNTQAAPPTPDDVYASPDAWLCRPGRADLCAEDQSVDSIAADGSRTRHVLKPKADAAIDCFYVYPTISLDPNGNSSMIAGPGERRAVAQQFAPFSSVCRPFAPIYRQITLAGLMRAVSANPLPMDPEMAVEDVRAAWRYYLANDNKGRGVVLVGHSQGARMITELMKRDIDGQPAQKLLVSALSIGFNFNVPANSDRGGALQQIPVCSKVSQTGCVIAYSTFRATSPPPMNSRFGRATATVPRVACADPVKLSGVAMRSMLATQSNLVGAPSKLVDWNAMLAKSDAKFINLPDLMTAQCVSEGSTHYLSLAFDPAKRGQRPEDIPGDIVANEKLWDDWGLHLIDMNIVMGNLLEIVNLQTKAYVGSP